MPYQLFVAPNHQVDDHEHSVHWTALNEAEIEAREYNGVMALTLATGTIREL